MGICQIKTDKEIFYIQGNILELIKELNNANFLFKLITQKQPDKTSKVWKLEEFIKHATNQHKKA
jgi:hypothetical protein